MHGKLVPDGRACGGHGCDRDRRGMAQSFPDKPVRIFVPYPAGGGVDVLTRTLGEVVAKQWGQSVVVENRPGAGGMIASQALVSSPPDGYTLIMVASGHATNAFLYPKLPYDTFKDFTPISLLASSPNVLLVRADSPFKTVADVIAAAKAKPGSLSFAHAGNGTSTHLAGELLKNLARVDITAIPYKGGAPAINDLLGGQIPMSFNNGPESVGQIQAGTVRALAVTTAARAPFLPDVPACRRRCRATTPRCGGACSARPTCRADLVAKLARRFHRGAQYRCGEGAAEETRRTADRRLAAAIRCKDSCRLRQMGADHQGRRHEGGVGGSFDDRRRAENPRDQSRNGFPN